jgi:hypothetical protein
LDISRRLLSVMAIHRVFIGWDGPALGRVVAWLAERFGRPGVLDLSAVIVALPGARGGRRLLELLVQWTDERRESLHPPQIVTVGRLPELLYHPKKPFASNLVQHLAWTDAVKRTDASVCKRLIPTLPAQGDLASWLALGEMLGRLHRELAADGLDFSDVAACGQRFPEFRERDRWQCLAALQREYLRTLDGLELWDVQTARLVAIKNQECGAEAHIILAGLVDLNRTQRQMLDQVAESGPEKGTGTFCRDQPSVGARPAGAAHNRSQSLFPTPDAPVTALIFAPQKLAGRFDKHGCIRPEAWLDERIALETEQIEVVDNPSDQAAAVLRAIGQWGGRYSAEQITIGVPDERLVPYVEQQLEQSGIRARHGIGRPVSQSAPYKLLAAVADYLDRPQYASLAALVRHPAMHRWLTAKGLAAHWLTALDEYYSKHLPHTVGAHWAGGAAQGTVGRAYCEVQTALAPLRDGGDKVGASNGASSRPLDQWGQPIIDLLVELLGDGELDSAMEPDRSLLAACKFVQAALAEHAAVPQGMAPSVTASEAIRLVLRHVEGERIPAAPDRDSIPMLGWLELPLDDAPALIVTGLNEGFVPSSLNADLFLPNQLRRALGLEDNDRRCARDAYALSMLAASRETLKVIAGRRSSEGDPLVPSRLLFACDDKTMARRVKAFFSGETSRAAVSTGRLRPGRSQSQFAPPRPLPLAGPIAVMRVTQFKDYLACPYRFYLRHVLGLQALADSSEELDGAMFGSLAHAVLDEFGKGPLRASTNARAIGDFLSTALNQCVCEQFGENPLAAVLVQVEQLRTRLTALAGWQAAWAAQGWQIERTEVDVRGETAALTVDGQPMYLRGRIDRIDVHADGRRVVFDYKSSDALKKPEQTHCVKDQWIDLQLPLYRHLAAGLGMAGPIGLGYIVLPKDISKAGALLAEWTEEELRAADRTAEEVVRGVRAQRFWPPTSPPPEFSEEFSAICQDGQFGSVAVEEDDAV